jgi:hypothetical protein
MRIETFMEHELLIKLRDHIGFAGARRCIADDVHGNSITAQTTPGKSLNRNIHGGGYPA